jgi:EAL domain-containing protein (putative c-di-GMP-specific phosphodiesterase class I)/CheY-like chemotaxis protein
MTNVAYVLDDDARVRLTVFRILSAAGYQTHEFSASAPMMTAIRATAPDVIILDLALGECDAVDVIRELGTLNYRGNVLLISGHDETVIGECHRIGERRGLAMLAALPKPFRANDLLKRLATSSQSAEAPAVTQRCFAVDFDLAEALGAGWLELWYQPKIELRTFSICGAEALLRARHPDRGIVLPAVMLPCADETAHRSLSTFVLGRAMADWKSFADAGMPLKLSVNMPVSAITAPDFVTVIRKEVPQDDRFPGMIIEVTEDEMVGDASWIQEVSTQLKLLKVGISIDDFGTAYSSLSRLLELPCVELKLDRAFVSNCSVDRLKHALCQTVIDLAHRVGSIVCAEGVETIGDLHAVNDMGCDTVQGFIFSKALPADAVVTELILRPTDFADRISRLVPPRRHRGRRA